MEKLEQSTIQPLLRVDFLLGVAIVTIPIFIEIFEEDVGIYIEVQKRVLGEVQGAQDICKDIIGAQY